jgi:hypothetical protein
VSARGVDYAAIPDSGLLYSWPVNSGSGPIEDQTGTNDLSVVGGTFDDTTATWEDGWAFWADGSGDRAEAGSVISENEFTVCQWVYPTTLSPTVQDVVVNGTGANHFPRIRISDSDTWNASLNGSFDFVEINGGSVSLDQLTLVSVRFDGATLSIVENTTETDTTSVSVTSEVSSELTWADENGGGDFPFEGGMDWGVFYSEWKTDSEIQQIYDAHPST